MANNTFAVPIPNSTKYFINCTRVAMEWCHPSAYAPGVVNGAAEVVLHGRTVCTASVPADLQQLMGANFELNAAAKEGICVCSDSYAWNNDGVAGCTGNVWDPACISGTTGCGTWTVGTYLWLFMTLAYGAYAIYLAGNAVRLAYYHSQEKNGFAFNATGTTLTFLFFDHIVFGIWMLAYPVIIFTQDASGGTRAFKTVGIPFTAAFLSAFLLWTCLMWLNVVNASKRLKASGSNIKGPYVIVVASAVALFTIGILVGTFVLGDLQITSMISLFSCLLCAITYLVVGSKVNALAQSLNKGGSSKKTEEGEGSSSKKKKRGGLFGIVDCARRQAANLFFYIVAAGAYSFFPTNETAFSTIGQPIMVSLMFGGIAMLQSTGHYYVDRIIRANRKKNSTVRPSSTVVTSTTGD